MNYCILCGWEICSIIVLYIKKKKSFFFSFPASVLPVSFFLSFSFLFPFSFPSVQQLRPPSTGVVIPSSSSSPPPLLLLLLLLIVRTAAAAVADGVAGQTGGAADLTGARHFRWLQAVESLVQAWFFSNSFNSLVDLFDFWIFFYFVFLDEND